MRSKFDRIYKKIKNSGGARRVSGIDFNEEATAFLINLCTTMSHAPLVSTLLTLDEICAENVGEHPALVYAFRYFPKSMCQNAFIFLVNMKNKIRFFAVETDLFCDFCLCEYADGVHKNYGEVNFVTIRARIKEIIDQQ